MKAATPFMLRPLSVCLSVGLLCAFAAWFSFAAATSKKRDELESARLARKKEARAAAMSHHPSPPAPPAPVLAMGPAESKETITSAQAPASAVEVAKLATPQPFHVTPPANEPVMTPPAPAPAGPEKEPGMAAAPTPAAPESQATAPEKPATTPEKKVPAAPAPGKEGEKPKDDGKSKEASVAKTEDGKKKPEAGAKQPEGAKDVTDSRAESRDMDGHHGSDDHGPDPEEEAQEKADAARRLKGTAGATGTPSEMQGWDLIRHQERDYVTSASIQRFYRFSSLGTEGESVWFRSPVLIMKGTVGSQDLLINNIKFIMSYPVVELDGKPCFSRLDLCKLIDPVLRPSYIGKGMIFDTVILDPGHGGHDSGARGIYGYEKDFSLKLAFVLKGVLEKQGLRVLLTRSTDLFISLSGRVAYANKIPNSIYVSLHYNSGGSSATGIETFALSPQGSSSIYGSREVDGLAFRGNRLDSENIALATAIHASVVHRFKMVDRGVKRARWHVLKGLERPGVLFEGGFVTNAEDAKFIAADSFRVEMATTIAQAIMNYRKALQPGKTTTSR